MCCLQHQIARARIFIPAPVGFGIHRAQFPLPERIVNSGPEPLLLFIHSYLKPKLDQDDARVDDIFLNFRAQSQKAFMLLGFAEAHDIFDASAIIPAAVEDDDLASSRKMLHIALKKHLALFPVRRSGKRDDPEYAGTYLFGDRLDRAALARSIPAF